MFSVCCLISTCNCFQSKLTMVNLNMQIHLRSLHNPWPRRTCRTSQPPRSPSALATPTASQATTSAASQAHQSSVFASAAPPTQRPTQQLSHEAAFSTATPSLCSTKQPQRLSAGNGEISSHVAHNADNHSVCIATVVIITIVAVVVVAVLV